MRCPTCRAEQEWSDACRRCKSDLRLVREAAESFVRHRQAALVRLRNGTYAGALAHARNAESLQPDENIRRLVAVCSLLCGDFQSAVTRAGAAPSEV